jgi:hypothetical protein
MFTWLYWLYCLCIARFRHIECPTSRSLEAAEEVVLTIAAPSFDVRIETNFAVGTSSMSCASLHVEVDGGLMEKMWAINQAGDVVWKMQRLFQWPRLSHAQTVRQSASPCHFYDTPTHWSSPCYASNLMNQVISLLKEEYMRFKRGHHLVTVHGIYTQ